MAYDELQEQEINLAINVFKGLDRKTSDELKQPGVAAVCQNWRFTNSGNLSRRPTYSSYNATSLGANPIKHTERIYIGANKYLIIAYDTTVQVGSDSAGTFASLKTGQTAGLHYWGETYKDFHYLLNGTDNNLKTDGISANTGDMGCTAMSVLPTFGLSAISSVLDTASYGYKFSWEYDSYQKANASALSSVATEINISATTIYDMETPVNSFLPSHLNIYRTEGGASIYYKHSRHTYGTASSWSSATPYVDETLDADLDVTETAPTDNGVPVINKYIRQHKERVFLAGDANNKSNLYFSKISGVTSYPDIYPVGNYLQISPDDGDEITGIAKDPTGYLCVFKKNSIRKVFTDGAKSNWSVSEPFANVGCWAPKTIVETPAGILFLSRSGWYIFNGQTAKLVSNSDRINEIITNEISLGRFDKAVGHFHNHLAYLSYTDVSTTNTYNDRVLIYDTLTDNFIIDTKTIDSFTTLDGADDWGEIYWGDSQIGKVYQEEVTVGGITYNKISDIRPNGTLAGMFAYNLESDPYLELGGHYTLDRMAGSSLNDWVGSALDDFPSAYEISGTYTSPPININAGGLLYAYWNESAVGDNTDVTLAMRTSNLSAGLSGAYSSEYTDPAGSDISSETAEEWLQFRVTMSSIGVSASNREFTPRIYKRGGYAIKLTYNVLGSAAETSVDCNWRGGYLQLTPEASESRLRRFMIDHDGTAGQLSCIWDVDYQSISGIFTVDLSNNNKTYHSPFPVNAFGKRVRLELAYESIDNLIIKAVNVLHSPQPSRY